MDKEAEIFGKYLCGEIPPPVVLQRYRAMAAKLDQGSREKALRSFILRFPFLLPSIDSALALFRPSSVVRTRLHVMFAVIECEPAYADRFMPGKFHSRGLFSVIASTAYSVLKAIPGSILLLFL